MGVTTLPTTRDIMPAATSRPTHSVIEELASVLDTIELGPGNLHLLLGLIPDHRDTRGVRHRLDLLLA